MMARFTGSAFTNKAREYWPIALARLKGTGLFVPTLEPRFTDWLGTAFAASRLSMRKEDEHLAHLPTGHRAFIAWIRFRYSSTRLWTLEFFRIGKDEWFLPPPTG
jgi:hypothetical protein